MYRETQIISDGTKSPPSGGDLEGGWRFSYQRRSATPINTRCITSCNYTQRRDYQKR
jgi:hypothetical protein